MTYKDLKIIDKKIKSQRLVVEKAETEETRKAEQDKLRSLKAELKNNIDSIPDLYIRNIIAKRLIKGYSWREVAKSVNSKISPDTIRMFCFRYEW